MAIRTNTDIIYFIRLNLIRSEFYANSEKLDLPFKTIFAENLTTSTEMPGEMAHIIIHEKEQSRIIYSYRFIEI